MVNYSEKKRRAQWKMSDHLKGEMNQPVYERST